MNLKSIEAAYLLGSLREPPSGVNDMRELLGCSRVTAYRWLKFVREFDPTKRCGDRDISAAFKGWARHA